MMGSSLRSLQSTWLLQSCLDVKHLSSQENKQGAGVASAATMCSYLINK